MPTTDGGSESGSAAVDFVLSSFALVALFLCAMGIATNLYLRTVLTDAATDAARILARADVSQGCVLTPEGRAIATNQARQGISALVGTNLITNIKAQLQQADGFCTANLTIGADFEALPLVNHVTHFEASAHATVEFQ
jgi:Flp pilus assembly protein TadG